MIVGDIFLSTVSRFRQAPQDPIEFLNDGDGYFALASDDGRAMLVAKENVDRVEALLPDDASRAAAAGHALRIQLVLLDGTAVTGAVVLDTPSGRSRLLDYLNSHRERFLPMHQEDRLLLVNRRAIVRVHELS